MAPEVITIIQTALYKINMILFEVYSLKCFRSVLRFHGSLLSIPITLLFERATTWEITNFILPSLLL